VWPGESAEEMALNFNLLLDRVIRSVAVSGVESA